MDRILELLINYSYLILFLGVVIEGEIFPLAAGFLISLSLMDLYPAIAVTFVGSFIGDFLWFSAASHWGRPLVDKVGRFLFITPRRLQWLEEHFRLNGKKTLFLTKFIYTFGHSSVIVAGLARMDRREFIKVDLASSFLWAWVFIFLGHFFGASFTLLQHLLRDVTIAALIIAAAIIALQFYVRRRLTKEV
ncbi:MAG: DedA family protein [Candidatus Kerfeldbacteria bacterium]|nr:DedA family protein [Candidatus Kerfeldbacteria bacterium]